MEMKMEKERRRAGAWRGLAGTWRAEHILCHSSHAISERGFPQGPSNHRA